MSAPAGVLNVERKPSARSVEDELPVDTVVDFSRGQSLHAPVSAQPVTKVRTRLGRYLGDALRANALDVHYQPQFEVGNGRCWGVEALARWVRPSGAIVAPAVFIPLAEQSGMIHELGAWVLTSACKTVVGWGRQITSAPVLSVNVSVLQINTKFVRIIERALEESGLPVHQLGLEITESALIVDTERVITCLGDWKSLGISIALDDFGTGYSSLSCLAWLPVDRLKLDLSLIHRMSQDPKCAVIVRSIVSLASDLGIDVCAEGVETERQLQILEDFGCPQVQGYLFGRPMPARQAQIALGKTWGNRPAPLHRQFSVGAGDSDAH
jgi:EAL domain-containing protein (putative c-di-GMP-specific phosphodiesterase class I)